MRHHLHNEHKDTEEFVPGYINLAHDGELSRRAESLERLLTRCTVCPHRCEVNRYEEYSGRCLSGYRPVVYSYGPHHGEERPLSGRLGSGTIFFGSCNLRCVFCQNYTISQRPRETHEHEITIPHLASIMLSLQKQGCHNINFVSPTHFVPQIVRAVEHAAAAGLYLPLVYNSNGYDSVEVLRLLDGVMDIYLPDLKYGDDDHAYKYSKIKNYVSHAREALREMYRQVGTTSLVGNDGIMYRGLILRHLILPNDISRSTETIRWIAENLSPDVYLSVMSQYHPANRAFQYNELNRRLSHQEFLEVVREIRRLNMTRAMIQGDPIGNM
jgi:putative pyruvate formate lyase activating enzyme